jgi:hypothetical protein
MGAGYVVETKRRWKEGKDRLMIRKKSGLRIVSFTCTPHFWTGSEEDP